MAKRDKSEKTYFNALMGDSPRIETTGKATGKVGFGDGLTLIIGEGAQRSWLWRYQFGGKACELNLGSAHKLDLSAARLKVAACDTLRDKGIDPRSERVATKAAARKVVEVNRRAKTLYEMAKAAAEDIGPKNPKKQPYWANQLRPEWTDGVGGMAVTAITHEDVVRALKAIRERCAKKKGGCMEQSRRVEIQMRVLFEWCAAHPKLSGMAEDAPNPAEFTKRQRIAFKAPPKRTVGHAAIPVEHVVAATARLRAQKVTPRTLAVEWDLLSVIRASCVTSADWSEIDRAAKLWTVPARKMKIKGVGDHKVPLTARHLEILDALVAMNGGVQPESGLMFDAMHGGEMRSDKLNDTLRAIYPQLIRRVDHETGLFVDERPVCVHGLRTTFRTWAGDEFDSKREQPRFDGQTLELCMAHVVGSAAKRAYDKSESVAARRVVLNAWADFVSGKVKAFRAAA